MRQALGKVISQYRMKDALVCLRAPSRDDGSGVALQGFGGLNGLIESDQEKMR